MDDDFATVPSPEDVVWGVDQPLIRQCEQDLVFRKQPVWMMLYRGWTAFFTLHEVDGEICCDWHGTIVHADGQIRNIDKTTGSRYTFQDQVQFMREMAQIFKAMIDHAWTMEPAELQAHGKRYEDHMRELHARDREKPPHTRAPWLHSQWN